jgi:hypothetical protein
MLPLCDFVWRLISHRRLLMATALPLLLQALSHASTLLSSRAD